MRDLRKLRPKLEIRLDNRQIALIAFGAMILLAAVFSIGVLVGKGLGQMQAQPVTPTPIALAPTPTDPDPLSLAAAYTDDPSLQPTPEELTPEEPLTDPNGVDVPDQTPLPTGADVAPAVAGSPDQQVDFGAMPGPPPGGDFWTVQVGSYPTQAEAQETYSRLVAKGNRVFIEKADLGERGMWFRVSVGQYATEAGARAMSTALRERENLDTWVRYVP